MISQEYIRLIGYYMQFQELAGMIYTINYYRLLIKTAEVESSILKCLVAQLLNNAYLYARKLDLHQITRYSR